ncbi:MAG: flagellin, partial [Alphaproteobacteria bacterium]|nr:flagellin [Alphaproteobacteria bacterium]
MPLNLISNFAANVAQRNLGMSDAAATNSLAKLSAGTRVLSAKDDAASLAVGSRLSAEIIGLKQASVNAGQAISMLQIADGAMAKVNDVLTRMKSLAVQSGSGQLSAVERGMLDTEFQALVSEVDRIANDTEFAGTKLVDGTIDVSLTNAT